MAADSTGDPRTSRTATDDKASSRVAGDGPIQVASTSSCENAGQVAKLVRRIIPTRRRRRSVKRPGVTIVGVSTVPVAKAGDHSALFRVTLSVKSGATAVPVYSDFLYVSQGRAQYFVNVVAPGAAKSELASLENGIAKKLAARAKS